jgi:hypothetical protein
MEPSVTLDGRISGRKWDLAQEYHKVLRSWAAGDVPLDFLEGYAARSEDRYDASDASLAPDRPAPQPRLHPGTSMSHGWLGGRIVQYNER